jgi:hypothetical protein
LVALEEDESPGGVCYLADGAEGIGEVVGPVALVFPDAAIAIEVGVGTITQYLGEAVGGNEKIF